MDCGPNEFVCHFFDWLARHPHTIKQAFQLVDGVWNEAGGQLIAFLKEHGEKLVAIASFSFAVYRWWRYRERILHKRLEEYIRESDARLGPASAQTVEALLRPGKTAALPQPTFALELRDVLASTGWDSFARRSATEKQAEKQLGRALGGIRKRQLIARTALQSLVEQQTQVHLLAGAVAAARARRKTNRSHASRDDYAALREFRKVLQFPTHNRDVVAKECEAFQLLRLGRRVEAFQAYADLENFAATLRSQRERHLTTARAKRFRAQILQTNAGPAGALAAWNLIANNNDPQCSVQLRGLYGPFVDWEAIEQAEVHFVAAWVAHMLGFVNEEPAHLTNVEVTLKSVLDGLPKRRWFIPHAKKALRNEANAGLQRAAKARNGDYDKEWLLI